MLSLSPPRQEYILAGLAFLRNRIRNQFDDLLESGRDLLAGAEHT
jgi:hypothetical protein